MIDKLLNSSQREMETIKYTSYGAVPFIRKSGEILFLIISHGSGHWGFPKGHQKLNETPVETARRELYEETGVKEAVFHEDIHFDEHYKFKESGQNYDKTVTYFLAEVKEDNAHTPKVFQQEIKETRWVSFKEGMKTLTFEAARVVLKSAHNNII